MTTTSRTSDVYELVSRLSATRGYEEMLDEVLTASLALMQANMGYLALYDPHTHIASCRGLPEEFFDYFLKVAPIPLQDLPPGRALSTGKRVIVSDVYADEALKAHLSIVEFAGFVSMQATPLITRNGQPVGMICTYWPFHENPAADALETLDLYARLAADHIERERTKEALVLSEERLRLATESANVYPWEIDLRTRKVWYAWSQRSPGSAELITIDEALSLIHPWDKRRVFRAIVNAERYTGEFALEHRGMPNDREVPWYEVSGRVIRDGEGHPERIVGVTHEITRRKLSQTLLKENEERFRRLYNLTLRISQTNGLQAALDEILDAVLHLLSADMGHIWFPDEDPDATPSFAAVKHVPEEYLRYVINLPKDILAQGQARQALAARKLVAVEDVLCDDVLKHHAEAMREAGIAAMLSWPLIGRSGKVLGILTAHFGQRHRSSSEQLQMLELYGMLAVATVEREEQLAIQQQTEGALRDALTLRNEFLGLVSHELRTPMTIIRGLASVLDRQDLPRDEVRAVYGDLRDESERLYWLIENMLRLARVEAGQRPESDDILLYKSLQSTLARLERNYPTLQLKVQLPSKDIVVSAIETYLEQILHNLLQNASKYNKPGASVEITTVVEVGEVQIRVADRGIGIKDPHAIFQPFQREERAEKQAGGLGLGLAVCKTLVEAQGGQIWAEQRRGGGTVFCFNLPRVTLENSEGQG